jgi:hypothetical protein
MSSMSRDLSGDATIDLLNGSITVLRLNLVFAVPSITVSLRSLADGVITQVAVWNQSGSPIPFKILGFDSNLNPIPVIVHSPSGGIWNLSKQSVTLPSGSINSAIGGVCYDTSGNPSLIMGLT